MSDPTHPAAPLDLAALIARCAEEPIHAPGAVQAHGALLGVDDDGLVVLASDNAEAVLGTGAPDLLGRPLADLLGIDAAVEMLAAEDGDVVVLDAPVGTFEAVSRPAGPLRLLEVEPAPHDGAGQLNQLHRALRTFHGAEDSDALVAQAASTVRELTGFDRVLVYRFDDDFNGEVVAQDAAPGSERFLGLRFPASDIPPQARALYSRARVRLIPDVGAEPSPLRALHEGAAEALDLSDVSLRAVSPVHLRYLRNMGVDASMSVAIHCHGALWGLITCHHLHGPLRPSLRTREAVDLVGRTTSTLLAALVEGEASAAQVALLGQLDLLTDPLRSEIDADPLAALAERGPALLGLVQADGVALVRGSTVRTVGTVPAPEQLAALLRHVVAVGDDVFATRELAALGLEPAVDPVAAGALVARIGAGPNTWVAWFRPELRQLLRWSGDPEAKAALPTADGHLQLSPRSSFEEYLQEVVGTSSPWTAEQEAVAGTLARRLADHDATRARHRAELAATLQRAVMLQEFPTLRDLDGAARYLPSADGPIGGDWYDVFFRAEGGPIVALGDVAGHGVEAAATMSQLRHALRAYLVRNRTPAAALTEVNDLMRTLLPGEMATGVLVALDPATRTAQIVNAGHLPPLIVGPDGARLVEHHDVMLGVKAHARFEPVEVALPLGSTLVLYSDGLIERRAQDIDDGLVDLLAAAQEAALAGCSAAEVCDRLVAGPGARADTDDDCTVVAVRFLA